MFERKGKVYPSEKIFLEKRKEEWKSFSGRMMIQALEKCDVELSKEVEYFLAEKFSESVDTCIQKLEAEPVSDLDFWKYIIDTYKMEIKNLPNVAEVVRVSVVNNLFAVVLTYFEDTALGSENDKFAGSNISDITTHKKTDLFPDIAIGEDRMP